MPKIESVVVETRNLQVGDQIIRPETLFVSTVVDIQETTEFKHSYRITMHVNGSVEGHSEHHYHRVYSKHFTFMKLVVVDAVTTRSVEDEIWTIQIGPRDRIDAQIEFLNARLTMVDHPSRASRRGDDIVLMDWEVELFIARGQIVSVGDDRQVCFKSPHGVWYVPLWCARTPIGGCHEG